jgi:hypothetical protein
VRFLVALTLSLHCHCDVRVMVVLALQGGRRRGVGLYMQYVEAGGGAVSGSPADSERPLPEPAASADGGVALEPPAAQLADGGAVAHVDGEAAERADSGSLKERHVTWGMEQVCWGGGSCFGFRAQLGS